MKSIDTIPTDNASCTDISQESPDDQYRINVKRGVTTLWRKHNHPALYAGYQIHYVALDTRLAREWLDCAGYDTFDLNMKSKH